MINIYVNDIRNALSSKCYYSALALALTIPDVCGVAAYPGKNVSERYIKWYDKYASTYYNRNDQGNPYLSGEMVYNLRNTYLHQGNINVMSGKIKEESNQVDKFIFSIDEDIPEMTMSLEVGPEEKRVAFRMIIVDIVLLCDILCKSALDYYEHNSSRFQFDYNILPPSSLIGEIPRNGDPIGQIIKTKWSHKNGQQVELSENLTESILKGFSEKEIIEKNGMYIIEKKCGNIIRKNDETNV